MIKSLWKLGEWVKVGKILQKNWLKLIKML